MQLGITSWGWSSDPEAAAANKYSLSCGTPGLPGVYSFVPSFRPWINQQIVRLGGTLPL